MKKIQNNKQGFTMVELLVVLVIVGILAAVATPVFLGNTDKAKASEAVATMSLIRQTLRDELINNADGLKTSIKEGDLAKTVDNGGLGIDVGITQYFSGKSFSVDIIEKDKTVTADPWDGNPGAVDFVVKANGKVTEKCSAADSKNCAVKGGVDDFQLQMDNSGRTYVSYDGGTNWNKF